MSRLPNRQKSRFWREAQTAFLSGTLTAEAMRVREDIFTGQISAVCSERGVEGGSLNGENGLNHHFIGFARALEIPKLLQCQIDTAECAKGSAVGNITAAVDVTLPKGNNNHVDSQLKGSIFGNPPFGNNHTTSDLEVLSSYPDAANPAIVPAEKTSSKHTSRSHTSASGQFSVKVQTKVKKERPESRNSQFPDGEPFKMLKTRKSLQTCPHVKFCWTFVAVTSSVHAENKVTKEPKTRSSRLQNSQSHSSMDAVRAKRYTVWKRIQKYGPMLKFKLTYQLKKLRLQP